VGSEGIIEGGRATYQQSIYLDSGATEKRFRVNSNCSHTECVTFGHEPNPEFQCRDSAGAVDTVAF
jgi:hypothetical protein